MRKLAVLAALSLPTLAAAQVSIKSISDEVVRVFNLAIPVLMSAILLFFFWGLVRYVNANASGNGAGAKNAKEFFAWAYANGDAQAKKLDYVPLPDSLVQQIEAYWQQNMKY